MKSYSTNKSQANGKAQLRQRRSGHWAILMSLVIWAPILLIVPPAVTAQEAGSKTIKIPDGTIISVTLTEELSSGKNRQNDPAHGIVAEEVKVGDSVVIAKGASVIGHVTAAEPKGRWGHSGSLAYSLDYAKAVDGSNVRLRASSSQGGEQSKAALMLGLSGAFKHGKDTDVKKGTTLSAYVDGDHTITVSSGGH